MSVNDIIELLEIQRDLKKGKIEIKKENINRSFNLAKHDFRVIENMEDVVETLNYTIEKLKECRHRVNERNKINIRDL